MTSRFSVLVIPAPSRSTCETSSFVRVDTGSGYLSSLITDESGCGTEHTPWVIDTNPGQYINFTLWDFHIQRDDIVGAGAMGDYLGLPTYCHQYALITERLLNKTHRICAGSERTRHVYQSRSASVEVKLIRNGSPSAGHFLLHFESEYHICLSYFSEVVYSVNHSLYLSESGIW